MKNYIQELPDNSWLAFDVNIANKEIGRYARAGHIIVCCCKEAESDESFLERAFTAGATHVLGLDADLGLIIEKEDYDMIWVRET